MDRICSHTLPLYLQFSGSVTSAAVSWACTGQQTQIWLTLDVLEVVLVSDFLLQWRFTMIARLPPLC